MVKKAELGEKVKENEIAWSSISAVFMCAVVPGGQVA